LASLATPAVPAGAPEILYNNAPWVVFRIADAQRPVCMAQVPLEAGKLFQFVGFGKMNAVISAQAPEWVFSKHQALVRFSADGTSFALGGAHYDQTMIMLPGPVDALYSVMRSINDADELSVSDENSKLLGTFPITGMAEALRLWKDCTDKLSAGD
jgi:hypothetical protein